jgi:hypothetical protein
MEDDQYEDDTVAIHAAVVRVIEKFVIGACVLGVLALIYKGLGWI